MNSTVLPLQIRANQEVMPGQRVFELTVQRVEDILQLQAETACRAFRTLAQQAFRNALFDAIGFKRIGIKGMQSTVLLDKPIQTPGPLFWPVYCVNER